MDAVLIIEIILGILFIVIFGPLIILGLFKLILSPIAKRNRRINQAKEEHCIIQIRVSKTNEKGPLLSEQLLNTLHGTHISYTWWDWVMGRVQTTFSFEIANIHNSIRFFVAMPRHLQKLVEGQLYAQYPDVEISEADDYAGFLLGDKAEKSHVEGSVSAELETFWHSLMPIRRYVDYEDKFTREAIDPLGGITATLDKLNAKEDQAWVQIVSQPAPITWQKFGWKLFGIYKKGYFLWPDNLHLWFHDTFMIRSKIFHLAFIPVLIFLKFISKIFFLKKSDPDDTQVVAQSKGTKDLDIIETTKEDKYWDLPVRKLSKNGYDAKIRMVYVPSDGNIKEAKEKVSEMVTAFKTFNLPFINGFKIDKLRYGYNAILAYAQRLMVNPCVLNSEELATLWHLPNKSVETPSIWWVTSRKLEPPSDLPNRDNTSGDFTSIGVTNYRGKSEEFGIKTKDRRRHVYIIGKTGMGKSTLLENMIFSDIEAGKGVAVVDPHGDLAETVLHNIPTHRTNDVVAFDPSDRDFPVAFNMLEVDDPGLYSVVTSGIVGIFKKMYADSWGPRLEHILRNTIMSLLYTEGATMLGIMRVLVDKTYRKKVIEQIDDPIVKAFWETEFEVWPDRQRVEAVSPIQNKVGQFLSSSIIRNILGQPKSTIDIRHAMDTNKIFVCNLSKGKIGEDNSSLLGSMMITKFQLDAMSRANIPAEDRTDFYLYVDEFQNFATESFGTILSEARKYKLNLTMANQFIAQMPEEVRDAVFGNVGSTVSFQVGFDDADYLSEQFGGEDIILPADLTTLPVGHVYLRLLVDNMPTPTFSARTFPPVERPEDEERFKTVLKTSRARYAKKREEVEEKISRWSEAGKDAIIKDAKASAAAANKSPWDKPEIPWRHEKNKDEFEEVVKSVAKEGKILDREEYEKYGVPKDANDVVFAVPGEGDKTITINSTVDAQGNVFFKKLSTRIEAQEFDPKTGESKPIKFKVFKDEKWQERLEAELRKVVPKEKQLPPKPKEENKAEETKKEDSKEENKTPPPTKT